MPEWDVLILPAGADAEQATAAIAAAGGRAAQDGIFVRVRQARGQRRPGPHGGSRADPVPGCIATRLRSPSGS